MSNADVKPIAVADGVYRLGTRWANFHLVADGDEAILVDAGYPGYAGYALRGLEQLRLSLTAILVTHHHVDHAGAARALRAVCGARVLVHFADADVLRGERRHNVPPGFYRQSWRPSMMRYLAHTVAAGGAGYRTVAELEPLAAEQPMDLPSHPRVVPTPGHTAGHFSVLLEDRGVLFTGDALVNFDYASAERGLNLHRFNDDRPSAFASLDRLAGLDAETLLFGHGDPWSDGGPRRAVELARDRAT